jgi:hypothetical protein
MKMPTSMPTSYKVAVFGLLALAAFIYPKPARAALGDTYAQSCRRNGGPGTVNREARTVAWVLNHWIITEQFNHNQCVAIWFRGEVTD